MSRSWHPREPDAAFIVRPQESAKYVCTMRSTQRLQETVIHIDEYRRETPTPSYCSYQQPAQECSSN